MALGVGGDKAATVKRGDSYTLTSSDLAATEGDWLKIEALPTGGTLLKNGVPMEVEDIILPADLSGGKIVYRHDGANATADKVTVVAVKDGESPEESDDDDLDFTITDNAGWLLLTNHQDKPAEARVYQRKWEAAEDQAVIDTRIIGTTALVEFTSSLNITSYFTKDQFKGVTEFGSQYVDEYIQKMKTRLVQILKQSDFSALKTAVNTYGAGIELNPSVWNGLTDEQRAAWKAIRDHVDTVGPQTIEVRRDNFLVAVSLAAPLLS